MNTVLSTSVEHQHPEHPVASRVRRVSFADRIALHVGLALITWSRRSRRSGVRLTDPFARNARALEREAREREWQRASYLARPWR